MIFDTKTSIRPYAAYEKESDIQYSSLLELFQWNIKVNVQEGEDEISRESEELDTAGPDTGVQPNVEQARDEE